MYNFNLNDNIIAEIYKFNNDRRGSLLKKALEKPTKFEQLKFIVDYFLNYLSLPETASIDNVLENKVVPFIYDYSFVEDFANYARTQQLREYTPGGFAATLNVAIIDSNNIKAYPSIYALKMATCQMLSSEIARFASIFGIDCKIVNKITPCYDNFNGTNINHEIVLTDQIVKMKHYYNIVNIDGKKLKIDIAGALTGFDYNNNHPENAIDLSKFYFSEDIDFNPFEHLKSKDALKPSEEDFSSLLQPLPQ